MIVKNSAIESKLLKELGYIPSDKEIFDNFIKDISISWGHTEQEARLRKFSNYPCVISGNSFIDIHRDLKKYVLENMAEYIEQHEIAVNKIDFTKIVYWAGMYILEKHNHNAGIKFLLAHIENEIYQDTGVRINEMMKKKIIRISSKGSEVFLKYYGRFGLYHSLKQIHKTLNDTRI